MEHATHQQVMSQWSGKASTGHVPETTSNDIGLQEAWSGLSSHNTKVVPIPQSSEEGSKWLSRSPLQKPLTDGSQIYGDASYSLDAEMTTKNTSGFWAHPQKASSHNFNQPQYKPNGCNVGETVALGQDAVLKTRENENKFQHLAEKMSHGGHVWKAKAGPNSTMGLEHGMSLMGSSQVNREDSSSNNLAAIPNSSIGMARQETNQMLPSRHHFNHRKHADASMKSKGRDDSRKTHETENCYGKENSSDSHNQGYFGQSNFFETMKVHYLQGYMLDLQGNEKEVDDAPPRGGFVVMAEGIPSAVPFKKEEVMMGGSGRSLEDVSKFVGKEEEAFEWVKERVDRSNDCVGFLLSVFEKILFWS
ncbi:hypothetical protein Acr_26g0003050 [Actinidia rufa]|uniref:Uncharacterized protein n=1 Tax=Actinidia rufa TaxID=165716 RepID=A0A7J0H1Z8_9ERIC|nr:hypothetical protein Acr_26g0003050 [Actinidia rufa]